MSKSKTATAARCALWTRARMEAEGCLDGRLESRRTAHDCHVSRLDCVECECQSYGGGPVVARQTGMTRNRMQRGGSVSDFVLCQLLEGRERMFARLGLACSLLWRPVATWTTLSATAEGMMGKSARAWRWRWSAVCSPACRRAYSGVLDCPGPLVLARVVVVDAKSPCVSWCLPCAADNRYGRPAATVPAAMQTGTTFHDSGVVDTRKESPSGGPWRREWATHMRLRGFGA